MLSERKWITATESVLLSLALSSFLSLLRFPGTGRYEVERFGAVHGASLLLH